MITFWTDTNKPKTIFMLCSLIMQVYHGTETNIVSIVMTDLRMESDSSSDWVTERTAKQPDMLF